MNPQQILYSIIFSLITGLAASTTLQCLKTNHETPLKVEEIPVENPLYGEFRDTGRRFGLNMEFARHAGCHEMSLTQIVDHHLLSCEKQSRDIIIFGDSSIAWGIIPEVIEQMTGLKVGIFAFEAFPINLTSVKVIDLISSYYLKPGGMIILGFSNWFHEQNANGPIILHADWMNRVAKMVESEFANFIAHERNKPADDGLLYMDSVKRNLDFAGYRKQYGSLKSYFSDTLHLSLFNVQLYADHIEPVINPGWHKKKRAMLAQIQCFIRWNKRSVAVRMDDKGTRSIYSDTPADLSFSNKNTALVSTAVKNMDYRKVFLIPFKHLDSKYQKLRSIYQVYYRDGSELIDLGMAHPREESYQMDEKEHPINTGSLYQSILLGNELRSMISTKQR